jgi:hypothetical protein
MVATGGADPEGHRRLLREACGEILPSSLLHEITASSGDIRFQPPQDVELKGLSGTYPVHEVIWA